MVDTYYMDGQTQTATMPPLSDCAVASEDLLPFLRPEGDFADRRFARIGFVLFLLANMALICRPADLFPALLEYPIYEPIMIASRSEEHTSDSSHVEISYAVFCLKKKK